MKNKFLKYFLLILFLFEIDNIVFANEFTFDSKEINISGNGNIINASEGTATSLKDNNKIRAKSFQYNNSTSILLAKNVIAELNRALDDHELIKLKIFGDKSERAEIVDSLKILNENESISWVQSYMSFTNLLSQTFQNISRVSPGLIS